jgi:ribosomal-protein-alanine N-acetyltransferase
MTSAPLPPDPFAGIETMPSIETERLVLRPIVEDDAAALFAIFSDAEVMRYWSWPPFTEFDQAMALAREIAALWRARSLLQWGITRRERGGVIGTVTLFHWDRGHRRAEIGYILARAHQGRGYAREAVADVLRFGFERMDLHRIAADTDPANARSIRLLESFGFLFEGRTRESYFHMGAWQDAALYGLLRREWGRRSGGTP